MLNTCQGSHILENYLHFKKCCTVVGNNLVSKMAAFGKLLSSAQQQVDEPQKKYGYTETSRFTDVRFGIFTTIKLEGSTE